MSCVVADRIYVSPSDPTVKVSDGYCRVLTRLLTGEQLPDNGSSLQGKFVGPKLRLVSREPEEAKLVGKDTKVEVALIWYYAGGKQLDWQINKLNENWDSDVRKLVAGYGPILEKLLAACKKVLTVCSSSGATSSDAPCLLRAPRLWQVLGPAGSGKTHIIASYISYMFKQLQSSLAKSSGLPTLVLDQGVLQGHPDLSIDDIIQAVEYSDPCFLLLERTEDTPYTILRPLAEAIHRWHDNDTNIFIFSGGPLPNFFGTAYCPVSTVTLYPLNESGRRAILDILCSNLALESVSILDEVVKITPGFSPCDLDELVRAVSLRSVAAASSAIQYRIGLDSFSSVVDTIVPATLRQQGALAATSVTTRPQKEFDLIYPPGRGRGFDSIIGQISMVASIREYLSTFLYSRGKGEKLIICGPPGSGKTHVAEAIASEAHAHLFFLTPASVLKKELGESEKALARIFQDACTAAPSVIVLEGVDYWGAEQDGSEHKTMRRLLATLVGQLDYLENYKQRVTVVATCNDENSLPPRVRLGPVYNLPAELSTDVVREILKAYLQGRADPNITDSDLDGLIVYRSLKNHSLKQVSDIVHWCREAAVAAVRRAVAEDVSDIAITIADLRSCD